jgi:AcrR family transcriptional regulator
MQYLKDEVRDKIVASAQAEFKAKGFLGASMRAIAAASGITPGNIYRYFSGKQALFKNAVSPAHGLMLELAYADAYSKDEAGGRRLDVETIMNRVMSVYEAHSAELMILFFGGEGSKCRDVKADLIRLIENRLRESALADKPDLALVMASSFVEGVLVALKRSEGDVPKLRELIADLISLFFKDMGGP